MLDHSRDSLWDDRLAICISDSKDPLLELWIHRQRSLMQCVWLCSIKWTERAVIETTSCKRWIIPCPRMETRSVPLEHHPISAHQTQHLLHQILRLALVVGRDIERAWPWEDQDGIRLPTCMKYYDRSQWETAGYLHLILLGYTEEDEQRELRAMDDLNLLRAISATSPWWAERNARQNGTYPQFLLSAYSSLDKKKNSIHRAYLFYDTHDGRMYGSV